MAKWRCRLFITMALVAIFASTLPALAWSCPMTGRVGSANIVCLKMGSRTMLNCRCAKPGSQCCKQVPVPESDTNGHSGKDMGLVHTPHSTASLLTQLSQTVPDGHMVATVPEPPLCILPPQGIASERNPTPLLLAAQYDPPPHQGRAPPAL